MESVCQKGYVYGDLVFGQESLANPEHEAESMISGNESDRFIEVSHIRGNRNNRISIREASNVGLPDGKLIDEELRTKFSSPFSESDCQNSTLINLKLQGQEHHPCSKIVKSFRRSGVSSSESSAPIKRSRSAGLNPQTLFCQVFGCSKDLSSSKDYHKRHKVCDSHSKTAKVIVNGIEQRFCQQCSRFHLLGEFDEGKRSCRKRLAGHNERRRKPNMRYHFGRNQRVQSFNDAMLNGISSDKTSSISKEIIPSDLLHFEKIGAKGWNHPIKAEFEDDCSKIFATPPDNYNLPTGDHLFIISSGNQYSGAYENQATVLSGSVINNGGDNSSQDIPELMCTDSSYVFTTTGIQNSNVFCSEPNFNGFSTTTSASALSFLSSQSRNSPSYSTGKHRSQTWSITGNPSHCNVSQVCDTLPEAFPVPLVNGVSHKLAACHLNPEMGDLHPMQIPENSVEVNFGDSGFFEGLRYESYDTGASCEAGLTIDLLRLSTHLQQVDRQNQSTYVMLLPDMCNTSSSEFHSASITSNGLLVSQRIRGEEITLQK